MFASGSRRSWATTSAKPRSSLSIRRSSVTSVRKTISPLPSLTTRCKKIPSMYPSPNGVS